MGNQFIMPKQVFYGENALKDAADVIATLGKKALVVTDPMMMKLGTAQMVTDLLDEKGVHYAIYSNITGEPTDKMIEAVLMFIMTNHVIFLSLSAAARRLIL